MSAFTPSPERGSLNGATAKILFAGDHADMPLVYSARDAVALPSLKHESFGRSAVEAHLMKRPVVVSDHGAFQETVIEGGVRLAAENMRVWEEGLSWFLAHPAEARLAMGRASDDP
ncbi:MULTISPECIES: glycosyltransferase [Brevundimonas]|jgi:glycosyltransferase involved in cell wall biosynthesis|uniref:glycosyltransferase n=1 Tax=Brevundimonas TaxID=41275 RepID=UPI0015BBA50E|nr:MULTISPECIES: glycosyltransferase [Brevundimonas]MBD3832027.1 glycosyltransferase [Brevundimonas sp.]NWE51524.1 glycosyltransferase [Brevundimonas sp. P7753]